MKLGVVAPLVAVAALGVARFARVEANDRAIARGVDAPYAPSPSAAPLVSLGYHELAADVFFVRLMSYLGGGDTDAIGVAALSEAIAALDPMFRRNYDVGPIALSGARRGVDNDIHLRAIALLEKAARAFPTAFRYPNLAGQIYVVDLQPTAKTEKLRAEQRRTWDEKGALLLETASRKPNAPADAGLQAAILQTRFGQRQHAIDNLRELILITDDAKARSSLLKQLGELTNDDAVEIAAELLEGRRAFEREWLATRNAIPSTFYVLLGKPLGTTFDLVDLAAGGVDLIGTQPFERLELPTDPTSPTLEDGPSSP